MFWTFGGPAIAADVTWTGGGTQNWNNGSSWGGTAPTSSDNAILATPIPNPNVVATPQIINLTAGDSANSVTFKDDYTLSGGSLALTAGTIHADMATNSTITGDLTGSAGLTKTGGGAVRLTNPLNSYTGPTSIQGGSIIISDPAALGGTGTVSITSGNNTPLNNSLVGFTNGSLVLDGTSSGMTFSRDIDFEGRGPLGDRSSAILSLGDNTLSGTLRSAISPLPLSPTASFRNSRINSVNGTLTLSGTLNAGGTPASTFTTLGGVAQAGVGNFSFGGTGTLTGTGSIDKSGGGTLFLNSLASNAGFTGTVRISGSAAGEGSQSSVRVTDLLVGGTNVFGSNAGTAASSTIDMRGGVLEFRNEGSLNIAKNVFQNNSSTFYTGPGEGGSGVNGTTTLGTFRLQANSTATFNSRNGYGMTLGAWTQNSSTNNNAITNSMGGTLLFTGNAWDNSDGSARTLTIGGNGNTTITGNINTSGIGTKTLTKTGNGLLSIVGTGTTLNGPVNVQGSLAITDFRSINNNTSSITLGNATTTAGNLIIGTSGTPSLAGLITSKPIVMAGTTASQSIYANQTGVNPVVLNGAITRNATITSGLVILGGTNTADNTVNAVIPDQGTGGVRKVGAGTWVLAGVNTYDDVTTIANGTLKLQANAAVSTILGATNDITFGQVNQFAGGTLEFVGQNGVNNVQTLDVLNTGQGANTIRLTPGAGGTASLSFTSLASGAGGSANIVGADFVNNQFTLNGADGLVNRTVYWEGADFAYRESNVLRAPVYGTDAGFVTSATALGAGNREITGSFSANSVSITSLKIAGSQNLTLNAGQTLTLSGGGLLATGGNAVITGGTALALGAQALVARVNLAGDSLTIGSVITGSAGLTKNGAGALVLSAANAQTGTISINEGTVRLASGGRLGAANANLSIRQGAVLDLNGVTPNTTTGQFNNNGSVTSAAAATFTVGGNGQGGTSFGTVNGAVSLTKVGTNAQSWLGSSTYTGVTTIGSTGLVTVDTLADGGASSGIGASTNAASNLVFNGSTGGLVYAGNIRNGDLILGSRSASTDRLFTLSSGATGATLSSTASNNNAIVWSNTGAIVNNTIANATLILTGSSTGDNTLNPQLADSSVGGGVTLGVTKTGAGQWNLGNSNNTYTGITTIGNGLLALNDNGALPANSPLVLGATTTNGTLQMSGTFARNLTAAPTAGTGTITFGGTTGGGGFAAHTGPLTVTLNGGAGLTWGAAGGFVPSGAPILLNSASALSSVNFTNDIDLGAANRTITVNDNVNTGADFAQLSGVLSGTGGTVKGGAGILKLTGANTYTGITSVQNGTLVVSSLGNSSSPGATSVGDSSVGNTDPGAITLGAGGNTAAALQYVGAGETSDRKIRLNSTTGTSSTNQIHADGSGPLILSNVANDLTAGAKALALRGSNTQGNMITSLLADNGGALSINVDGGASWILTNASNTFSGGVNVNGGGLGIADPAALGAGTLTNSNGNIFAYGADRTITNTLTLANNATNGWLGDYSLNFTGANSLAAAANNVTTNNSIAAGKSLTFNGLTANALNATRSWTFDGPGETVINGDFTTSTLFGVNLTKTGDGTLTLGTNGATSNWNQLAANNVDVDRGLLRFTTNNAIPTLATSGGLVVSPELATGDVATVDLNGTSQTINALTANTNGTVVIDNSAATPSTFTFGANNTAVNFGTGIGSYSITDSGASTLSIAKTGTGAGLISTGVTLDYSGTTSVDGGTLTIASPLNGTTGLSAINTSTLALTGGFTTTTPVASINVGDGATLSLLDGTGTKLTSLTSLTLGSSGGTMTTLNFNVGDVSVPGDEMNTDTLSLSGGTLSLFTGNQITFNITDTGLNPNEQYVLLDATAIGGGFFSTLSLTDYLLGGIPGGFTSIDLSTNSTTNQIILSTGSLITGGSWWNGDGALDNWNDVANWAITDKTGTNPAASVPGQGTDVIFIADNIAGGAAITTTLEQNFKINSLTFEASTNPLNTPSSITIAPGAVSTNRLEIAPQNATDGIRITAGGSPSVTISAPLRLGANQTWNVADAASTLTLSGALQGERDVTKTGAGKVTLSAAADPLFNTGLTTDVLVSGGTLELTDAGALGTTANSNAANVEIATGGAFYYNNATSGTVNTPLLLSGGTLSAGGNNQTYSGAVNVSSGSTVNLADLNGAPAATARNITLSGQLTGAGMITINSNSTVAAGNQVSGNLIPTHANNSGFTGGFNILRGTLLARNALATGTGPINVEFGRVEWESAVGSGTIYNVNNNLNVFRTGGNAIAEWNVDRTAGSGAFSVVHGGAITLGGAGVGETGALRVLLQDNPDTSATFNGNVNLAGNSSIHVRDNATGAVGTFNGIISGPGSLAINGPEPGGTAWGGTAGIVVLNGVNTYTGGSTLAAGTLRLGDSDALGTGSLTVTGTSTIQATADLSGANAVANATTLNAALTVSGNNNLQLSGTFTGTGADANRTLTNNVTGPAALTLSGPVNLGAGANAAGRILTVAGAGATTISGVVANGNAFANGITKVGAGTLTLSNTNTYTGATLHSANVADNGVILATATDALGTGAYTNIFVGASRSQLQLSGGITLGNSSFTTSGVGSDGTDSGIIRSVIGNNIISGTVNMAGGAGPSTYRADAGSSLAFNGNVGSSANQTGRIMTLVGAGDFVINGVLQDANSGTGTAGLTSNNTGTTTLNAVNTYTQATTVRAGLLTTGIDNAIPDATAITVGGAGSASLLLGANFNDSIGNLTLGSAAGTAASVSQAGTAAGTGVLTLLGNVTTNATGDPTNAALISGNLGLGSTGTRTFTVADSTGSVVDLAVTANVSGAGNLTKAGAGVMALAGTNTYTGATNVNAGVLAAGSTAAFGNNSAVTVAAAGTLTLAGSSNSIGSLAGAGMVDNATGVAATLTTGGNNTSTSFSGIISDGSGGSALSLDKVGSGTQTLSGPNTYSGGTTVSAGTLLVNNTTGSGTGSGTVFVDTNGTLGGNGIIAGATTISGTHSPGNSPGLITHNSDLTYTGGSSNVIWQLTGNTIGVRGTDYDGIDVGGNLDFAGATTLTLDFTTPSGVDWDNAFWDSSYLGTSGWLVYSYGTLNLSNLSNLSVLTQDWVDGTPNNFSTFQNGSFGLFHDVTGQNIYLEYTAVPIPEPTSLLMVGLGLIACGRRGRNRKAKKA